MSLETLPFDAAEHLDTPASQAELLADALKSGDAAYIADALGIVARARGMSDIAREAGISRAALFEALVSTGGPDVLMLRRIAGALSVASNAQPVS